MKASFETAPVLLTGGTSQVGVFVLPQLSASGMPVISLSRRIAPQSTIAAGHSVQGVLWIHPSSMLPAPGAPECKHILSQVELLLSCGPVELAAKLLADCPRLVRVVCVSSSSVFTKTDSRDRRERQLIGKILAAEADLRAACTARNIQLVVLRPTLIYGCGLDENVSRLARWIRRLHFIPVAGDAAGLRQPIHAEDVASTAVKALLGGALDGWDGVLKGGSTMTYREMVEKVFRALGREPRIWTVPPGLLAGMLKAASMVPGWTELNPEFAWRQNRDLAFEGTTLPSGFPVAARPFAPTVADFEVPAEARAFQPG